LRAAPAVSCRAQCAAHPSNPSPTPAPRPAPRWPERQAGRQVLFVHSIHSRSSPSATTATVPPSDADDDEPMAARKQPAGRSTWSGRPRSPSAPCARMQAREFFVCGRGRLPCAASNRSFRSQPAWPTDVLPRPDAWCVCRLLSHLTISTAPLPLVNLVLFCRLCLAIVA